MNILQVIQKNQTRGAETFACQLSNHLLSKGVNIILVSLFEGKADLPFKGKHIKLKRSQGGRFLDIKGFKQLSSIIREEKIDIVQANAGDTLKYVVLSKLIFHWKAKVVFRNASTVSQYIKSIVVKLFNKILYRFTDAIISVTEATKVDLTNLYPEVQNKITVIPVGVEQVDILENNIKNEETLIVHVGGFSFEKNHVGLIEIFEGIVKYYPDAKLILVGDGPLRKSIEDLVQEKGLSRCVTFIGFSLDPLSYISRSKVLVLPSLLEGLPGVILEAFYCKVPVIAYNVGGIGDIVKNLITGRLIERGNQEDFQKAIIDVLESPEGCTKMIEEAYKVVVEQYLNRHLAERFFNEYVRLLQEN